MAATSDQADVGSSDDAKLRRFLAARRRDDWDEARRWWEGLLESNFDRIRTMVRLEAGDRLSADEKDEAVQRALIKIDQNMIRTFEGVSMGQWVNACRTLVRFACIDEQRKAERINEHLVWLDRAREDADGDVGSDGWQKVLYNLAEHERSAEEDEETRAERLAQVREFLAWALPRLTPRERSVAELDVLAISVPDMQLRLNVSENVVHATRRRAKNRLGKLWEEWNA